MRWSLRIAALSWALAAAPAWADEVPISENANRRFAEAVRYLTTEEPDRYEKAYQEFKAAYADSPSWKILGNLGIVALELERDGEAIEAFRGYLEGGGDELSAEERQQFERDLALVESRSMRVVVETVPEGAWLVDERVPEAGRPIINRYGPTSGPLELRVRAGHHRMHAELSGHVGNTWEFAKPSGSSLSHRFELRPTASVATAAPLAAPAAEGSAEEAGGASPALRASAYVALGLATVGLAAGTWFYLDGKQHQDEANARYSECLEDLGVEECPRGHPAERAQQSEHDAFARSTISFVAAGAFVATGVVLFLVSGSDGDADAHAQDTAVVPWLGADVIGVSGRF